MANCSLAGLTSGDHASNIDVLNFKNTLRGYRPNLEPQIFRQFRKIIYLNLQNSSISHLPNDVFFGLHRVENINLSFNKIKHLNGVVFKSLPSLRSLNLRGNLLSISPLEVIVSETLQYLDMGYCSLSSIPLYAFTSAPNLRHLILDGNDIQNLEYNALPRGLTYLNLANNNIVNAPINVFNSLTHLLHLDIRDNPINCSCTLLVYQDTLSGRAGIMEEVVCNNPPHLAGKKISAVNENQLCRHDYVHESDWNSLVYHRNNVHKRSKGEYSYDSERDDAMMNDGPLDLREPAEVMFTNDETNQMGSHMEARVSISSEGELENIASSTNTSEPEMMENDHFTKPEHESTETSVGDVEPATEATQPEESSQGEEIQSASQVANDNLIKEDSYTDGVSSTNDHSNTLHVLDDPSSSFKTLPSTVSESENTQNDQLPLEGVTETTEQIESKTEAIDEITIPTTQIADTSTPLAWPTIADQPDYNYDSQHDYIGSDNVTSSETLDTNSEPSDVFEGSGDDTEATSVSDSPSSTISFMEEHENETESSSFHTVSDDLDIVHSTVATEITSPSTDIDDVPLTTVVEPESTTEGSTEASITEMTPPELVSSSSESPSPSPEMSEPSTTEWSWTDLFSHVSTEPSSTEIVTSESSKTSSTTSSFWNENERDTASSSSTTEAEEIPPTSIRKGKTLHTLSDTTLPNEVELVKQNVGSTKNENIESYPSRPQSEKSAVLSSLAYTVPALLLALILVILTVIVCRRKRRNSKHIIRLPVDPETAAGTELQDMLLPKPPENGIKVLPKNYTNGTTPVTNGKAKEPQDKEEMVPVLSPDPEPEWDEKPEPIEAVTARMTVIAPPQTPIFIQKPLT